ncbi:MAG: TIGR03667 family PPOX class F420-dependent oxidoreductase [Candidatus Dormibacteraeota bacterium]|nr:TIGR03667 family PPOX class F420-dependent oxidoreductase [Candidatus Dormibacteraeota bacterium]
MTDPLPAADTPFGARVARRLQEELVIWYTSAGRDGTPQPNPVWFLWENGAFLVYNRASAGRTLHARQRDRVALHFDSDRNGDDIVVFTGIAEPAPDAPPPHLHAAYVAKYGDAMRRVSGGLEEFARAYPAAVRVRPDRVRGH